MTTLLGTPQAFRALVLKFAINAPPIEPIDQSKPLPSTPEQRETQRLAMARLRAERRRQDTSIYPPRQRGVRAKRL